MGGKLGAVALVAAVALTGCQQNGTWLGEPDNPKVVVMGDSLVYHAEGNWGEGEVDNRFLAEALADEGWYAFVSGLTGATVEESYRIHWNWPERLEGGDPDALVIALGTNDMAEKDGLPTVPLHQARAELEAWLGELPEGTCVRLVGVAENVIGLDRWSPSYNRMLVDLAGDHGALDAQYVPWDPEPAWLLSWDYDASVGTNPHMSPEGRTAYREHLVSAAASCRT